MIIDDNLEAEKKPLLRWWHVVIVFALGHICILFGALMKILSHPLADIIITSSFMISVFATFLVIVKVAFFRSKGSWLSK